MFSFAPVQQLQDSQIHIAELQDQVKDLQQQLASASTGSMLQAQETQGLTDAMQKQHEQELLEQRMQASQWKAQFQEVEKEVTQLVQQLRDGGLIAIPGQADAPNVTFGN